MKKLTNFLFIICLSLTTTQVIAQTPQIQTKTWNDGNPSFQNMSFVINVRVDSIVSLIPTFGFNEESGNFRAILPAIDSSWVWPQSPADKVKIVSAEDIERYTFSGYTHYVVTDKLGDKIIDLVLSSPEAAWNFKSDVPSSARYLNNPVDTYVYLENNQPMFLITDQGNNRVIKVDRLNDIIVWQYDKLFTPSDAIALSADGQVLICDSGHHRLLLLSSSGVLTDSLGTGILNTPVDIEYDSNTDEVLITDQGNNRVIKLNRQTKTIDWEYNIGLDSPTDADLLPNGNVLISDRGHNRLIEVDFNGQIVWQLETALENLSDADRLGSELGADWVNKHLVVTKGQPSLIGYITNEYISAPRYLNRAVGFDQLIWSSETENNTSILIQLRTGTSPEQLLAPNNPWRGPTETEPYYTTSGLQINPIHDGDEIYQFRAILQTGDPLYTPILNNIKVNYRYYDTEIAGQISSETISDSEDFIITNWKSLRFKTNLPPNPVNRDKVNIEVTILDGITGSPLRTFTANPFNADNQEALDNIENLKLKQSIKLQATLNTLSTAATPILNDWEVTWEATPLTDAQIDFVKLINQEFKSTAYYRAPEAGQDYIDYVNVKLTDPNLIPIQQSVNLIISSITTLDSEAITLSLQPEGWYLSGTSFAAVISDTVISNDGILQVRDRDQLVVSYTDPMNSSDQASDTALIVQNTEGIIQFLVRDAEGLIQIQNESFTKIDSASVGDTIFVHILGEKDRDLIPQQDKISIVVFDYETADEETLAVFEVPDSLLQYETGEFISVGLPLISSETPNMGDSLLQTFAGSRISAKYEETISKIPIIKVYDKHPPIPIEKYAGVRSLDFDIAPNPYYENRNNYLRIRVASSVGDLIVEKIEVYNFAGQKITEIDGSELEFYYSYPIPAEQFSYADHWWNLTDQNSVPVTSGTYWVKVSGNKVNTTKSFSHIKKLVIVR